MAIVVDPNVRYLLITPFAGFPAGYVLKPGQSKRDKAVAEDCEVNGGIVLQYPWEADPDNANEFSEAVAEGAMSQQLANAALYAQSLHSRGADPSLASAIVMSAYLADQAAGAGTLIAVATDNVQQNQTLPSTGGAFVTRVATPTPVQLMAGLDGFAPGNYVEVEYLMQFTSANSEYASAVTYNTVAALTFDGHTPAVDATTYSVRPAASRGWAPATNNPSGPGSEHKLYGRAIVYVDPLVFPLATSIRASVVYAGSSANIDSGSNNGSWIRIAELKNAPVQQAYHVLSPLA